MQATSTLGARAQVIVNGQMTTYRRAGDKTARQRLLVLHGWGDSSEGWTAFAGGLAESNQVVVLDLPGFGGSDMPNTAWGLSDYAAFTAAFLAKTGYQPTVIVGHSNGGAIVVRGLAEGTLQAERLVLLASAGIRAQLRGRRRVLRVMTKAGKFITYPLPAGVRKRLRGRLYTTIGSDLLVAEHMQETFKRIVTDDVQADASKLSLPTLLVYGEDDTAAPPQYGHILHNLIDGSTLEVIGGAGHFVHLDKPLEVRAMIDKFLV